MRLASLCVLVALSAAPAARAAELKLQPIDVHEAVDLPLTLALGTIWLSTELGLKDQFTAMPFDPLDYDAIGDRDRTAIGLWNPEAAEASDALLYTAFALPFVLSGADDLIWGKERANPARWLWSDAVVLMETVFFAGALTNVTKWAFNRYRPYMYIPYHAETRWEEIQADPDRAEAFTEAQGQRDAALSFWSGHTSMTFAAMFATATLLTYKHLGDHPGPLFAAWGGAVALGVVVGILRVQAGMHFPSDVLIGALVGAATGVIVPSLHRVRRVPVAVTPTSTGDGGGLAVVGFW